jgi:GDP-L-fucose synthase
LAEAVLFAADKYDGDSHLNVGTGTDLTIKELAELVAMKSGFKGQIDWDVSKPDGTPRKVLDVSRLQALGWKPKISLEVGISETIRWFESNFN